MNLQERKKKTEEQIMSLVKKANSLQQELTELGQEIERSNGEFRLLTQMIAEESQVNTINQNNNG